MKQLCMMVLVALGIAVVSGCGTAIKQAQDFFPGQPPTIQSITVSNPGNANVVPFSSYPVIVTASEATAGMTLSYKFTSPSGSFASQTITPTGCTVNFVAGNLAAGQKVLVYVTVSNGHGGYASSSYNVGNAKQGPTVTLSASQSIIMPTGSLSLSVTANCDGVFQIWPNNTTNPISTNPPTAIDTNPLDASEKPMRIYTRGTSAALPISTISLAGPAFIGACDAKIIGSFVGNGQSAIVWIVFQDGLNEIDSVSIPIGVDGTKPTVSSWLSPTANATGVSVSPTIQITFDEDINPATLTSGSLTVTSTNGGTSGTIGAPTYNQATHTATYPVSGLSVAANYTATLTNVITDIAGNSLDTSTNDSLSFATPVAIATTGSGVGATTTYTFPSVPSDIVFKEIQAIPDSIGIGITFPRGTDDLGSNDTSIDFSPTGTISKPFEMAETQVTYELWSVVYAWATTDTGGGKRTDGGALYSFANPGRMGGTRTQAAYPAGGTQQPVTAVNWHDAIVWCNALTEYYNANKGSASYLICVYYSDSNYQTPLRTSTNNYTINNSGGSEDNPYIYDGTPGSNNTDMLNCTATGFRLPLRDEYEYASRYIGTTNGGITAAITYNATTHPTLTIGYFWTPGSYASGAISTSSSDTDAVAWTGDDTTITQPVKWQKNHNVLGLYDMSGNGYEWCFDWSSPGSRVFCSSDTQNFPGDWRLQIGFTGGVWPSLYSPVSPNGYDVNHISTFRFVRNK